MDTNMELYKLIECSKAKTSNLYVKIEAMRSANLVRAEQKDTPEYYEDSFAEVIKELESDFKSLKLIKEKSASNAKDSKLVLQDLDLLCYNINSDMSRNNNQDSRYYIQNQNDNVRLMVIKYEDESTRSLIFDDCTPQKLLDLLIAFRKGLNESF